MTITTKVSEYLAEVEESIEGTGVDLNNHVGPCEAHQIVSTVSGTTPELVSKVQESTDNSTWTDVVGAVFPPVIASDKYHKVVFRRTKRYVRLYHTVSGTTPLFNVTSFFQQKLRMP